jgi:hypothetical protein
VAYPFAFGRIEHLCGLAGVAAERPFAIDMLAGLDCSHNRTIVVGHLDADRD